MAATYSSMVGLAVGGKYEIRRVMGVGGMGVVCEAIHLDLGKRVALKLIDKSMKESELIVARFRREARAAGQIDSEHIVDVFDVGADPRVGLYMVMEYLTGEDLQSRLERDKQLDVKTTVMICHQIARALSKAHAAGVIHRDLKPANVFLTQRDSGQMVVKLLDFGVSKLLDEAPGSARITGTGTPIGTPLYMSPEQAEGKADVDGRADIWSLGALMYEILSGEPPFADRGSYHGTLVGILTTRARPLNAIAPWVPEALARTVDAMLVHDREARLPHAAAVTQRLLEAYPSVLPDGTGNHTAVIIPQSDTVVDATGDTEFFTSASFSQGRPSQRMVAPRDSSLTMSDALTGSDVPLNRDSVPASHRSPAPTSSAPGRPRNPTAPLFPPSSRPSGRFLPSPSSSTEGLSTMAATPSVIEPLPPALRTSDASATLASPPAAEPARGRPQRSFFTIAAIVMVLGAVATASFLAGRRAQAPRATAATSAVPLTSIASTAPSAQVGAPPVLPASSASSAPASAAASASAPATSASVVASARPPRKPRAKAAAVASAAAGGKGAEPTVPTPLPTELAPD